MIRLEDEVLRDLRIAAAAAEGGLVRVVADALQNAPTGEQALLEEIAMESGGLGGVLGGLGSLWDRARQLFGLPPRTLRSAQLPPALPQPPRALPPPPPSGPPSSPPPSPRAGPPSDSIPPTLPSAG